MIRSNNNSYVCQVSRPFSQSLSISVLAVSIPHKLLNYLIVLLFSDDHDPFSHIVLCSRPLIKIYHSPVRNNFNAELDANFKYPIDARRGQHQLNGVVSCN